MAKQTTEVMELDIPRKWEYLKRYYDVAAKFYNISDVAVTEKEIDACVRKFKEKPLPTVRKIIRLKDWKFTLDENGEGLQKEFYSEKHDENTWEDVRVPHACRHVPDDPVKFGKTDYFAIVSNPGEQCTIWRGDYSTWFKKRLILQNLQDDEMAYISFESVNLKSDVWVNEYPVMIDHLGLFPFKVEVTENIRKSIRNEAVIAVRASNTASSVPELFYNGLQSAYHGLPYSAGRTEIDWPEQSWAGIAGDVTLSVVNLRHIEDAFITTEDILDRSVLLACRLTLRNASLKRFSGRIRLEISKWHPVEGKVIKVVKKDVHVLPMNDAEIRLDFEMEGAELWDIDSPNLYLAHILLEDENSTDIDDLCETFGVRLIQLKDSNFYLNHKKIVPRGTHDVSNYVGEPGICPSDRIIAMDLLLHKKMGAICSRWPSDCRMHYKRIADFCDQSGYLLSWAGYFEMWTIHPEAELYARRDVRAMIRSLRNCPSIIVWEMGDEPLMRIQDFRRYRWYEMMYGLVAEQDTSRPIIPAGYYCNDLVELIDQNKNKNLSIKERREKVLEDFPLFDKELEVWDFHHCPALPPLRPSRKVMDGVREALGGRKPTIFTEFGADGLPKPENIQSLYGKFRRTPVPLLNNSTIRIDQENFGRGLKADDWKETQAHQAALIGGMINYLRQYPDIFAGFYFVCMFDVWTFYWGAVDVTGKCKLMYYVAQNYFKPVFISGLHGNVILAGGGVIEVTASNLGEDVFGASLEVIVKDGQDLIEHTTEADGIFIKGDVAVTTIAHIEMPDLQSGLHSIEYFLRREDGTLLCKMVELFFADQAGNKKNK